jgi:transcriptional regulator with XRE-family HTH domain
MSFSRREPSIRHQFHLGLAGSIESQLRDGYAKRHNAGIDSQSDVARRLGVGRSVVNRRLLGHANMSVETIADMAWALGLCIKIDIFNPFDRPSNEPRIISEHARKIDGAIDTGTSITKPETRFEFEYA